ncbi:hypothetical protein JFK97_14900 [Chromobacterium phragmitis]|uniref:copper-binding protein n=1 Tax=Chromobacterium amazonense TaxID=1382803 RepID=UPI0021B7CBB0|nr:copper-binding protein [Chromobacterium amazonense]MBM2885683.1 hypothetical protein [Chromobacterium amazonense]
MRFKAGVYAVLFSGMFVTATWAHADASPAQLVAADVAVQQRETGGEVAAIDLAQRVVMLKGDQGWVLEFPVSPEVRNLEQLKVGDRVRIRYRSALALALKKGGDTIRKDIEGSVQTQAPEGGKPGVTESRRRTVVSNVVALDRANGVVTLEGPHGGRMDVEVRNPQLLDEIAAKDQVVAVITESAAVSIEPAR